MLRGQYFRKEQSLKVRRFLKICDNEKKRRGKPHKNLIRKKIGQGVLENM